MASLRMIVGKQQLRNQFSKRNSFTKDGGETFSLQDLMFRAGISTATETNSARGKFAGGILAAYTVYKGKAALSAAPVLPTFSKLDSGTLKVDRRGSIMLTFWPAIGERKYDWEKRQMFALSPTEVGSLISLGSKDSCELFHDPSMLSSNAGQVRKSLSIKPNDAGYFISLNVVNNIQKTTDRFSVPVSSAEFAVMRTAFSFALPHLMGWDRYVKLLPKEMSDSPVKVSSPLLRDLEWDR